MRANIRKYHLLLAIVFHGLLGFSQDAEEVISYYNSNENIEVEKKTFDDEEYQRLKKEVELVEEIANKKLKEDSSNFGRGYGVEHGKDYIVWKFDSISGQVHVEEKHRNSGGEFAGDGVRNDSRNRENRPKNYQQESGRRGENIGREGSVGRDGNRHELRKPRNNGSSGSSSTGRDGDFGQFFMILLLAVLIGAIAYFLFINTPVEGGSRKIEYEKDFDPTTVQLSELEIKINEAKAAGEYRNATRFYFIWVMKELSDQNHIVWKKKKTNYHYILEVSGQPFTAKFERSVNVFEYVWYGKYEISKEEFGLVETEFKVLIQQLSNQ